MTIGMQSRLGRWLLSWWLVLGCLMVETTPAEALEQGVFSESEQSVLQKATDESWYSAKSGERMVRSPRTGDRIDARDRHDVIETASRASRSARSGGNSIWDDFFAFIFEIWSYLLLIGIVVLALIALFFILQRRGFSFARSKRSRAVDVAERDRLKVTDLPFELEQSQVGLLAQSDEFRRRGDYTKAMIYLFSHLLVELDAGGLIRLERGKTNRYYLRELAPNEKINKYMHHVVRWFEHVFFGKNAMDADAFERLRARVPEFEGWLKGPESQREWRSEVAR